MTKTIDLTLKVWRQERNNKNGQFETYYAKNISIDMSFLEMLDVVNEQLTLDLKEPIAFDHDCREGICGMCGCMVNGRAHGSKNGTTLCQLHMRHFQTDETIIIEPFRALAFKVIKDITIDRSSFDDIIQAGGYVSINTGGAQDANNIPIKQEVAELSMDTAQCIGCGACVASCPNASAMLFTSAKISQLALLPQGKVEAPRRAINMIRAMDNLGFGNCSNEAECEADCPKEISISSIARMNHEYIKASLLSETT